MLLDREQIKSLAAVEANKCITVFIPTHKAGMEVNEGQDVIAYKNELQSIHRQLKAAGQEERDIDRFMKPMYDLIKVDPFWKHQLDGLAVFRNEEIFNYFRVPVSGKAVSSISSRFLITPVLPLLNTELEFFLLALGNKKVRLFKGTQSSIKEIELPDLAPVDLEEAIASYDPEKLSQERTTRINYDGPIDTSYTPDGYGNDHLGKQRYEYEYFRDISRKITEISKNQTAALVLAGVDEATSLYKEANTYGFLLKETIDINPERLPTNQLHEKAAQIVSKYVEGNTSKLSERYHSTAGTGKTSYLLSDILTNAFGGRVDTLFLEKGKNMWGVFDEASGEMMLGDQDKQEEICLLNYAASLTLMNSGEVILLDRDKLPERENDGAIAIYRY